MGQFGRVLWILEHAVSAWFYVWYISIPLICLLVVALYKVIRGRLHFPKRILYSATAAIAIPVMMAFLGGYFYATASRTINSIVTGLALCYVAFFSYEVFRAKGYRLFIFALGGLLIIFTLGIWFISAMSIYNDWI